MEKYFHMIFELVALLVLHFVTLGLLIHFLYAISI